MRLYTRARRLADRPGYCGAYHAIGESEAGDRALCGIDADIRVVNEDRSAKRFAAWSPNACARCSRIAQRDHSVIRECDACGCELVLPEDWPVDWQVCKRCRTVAVMARADEAAA